MNESIACLALTRIGWRNPGSHHWTARWIGRQQQQQQQRPIPLRMLEPPNGTTIGAPLAEGQVTRPAGMIMMMMLMMMMPT